MWLEYLNQLQMIWNQLCEQDPANETPDLRVILTIALIYMERYLDVIEKSRESYEQGEIEKEPVLPPFQTARHLFPCFWMSIITAAKWHSDYADFINMFSKGKQYVSWFENKLNL